jgi:HSP20 family protein
MSAMNSGPIGGSLERLRTEIDRIVESAWSQGERAADFIGIKRGTCPAVDIVEQSERVQIAIDLPGVAAESIDLSIIGNMLTVQGSYPPSIAESGQSHLSERPRGTFKRSVPLPASVNADDIRAESRNGVLYVSVGKSDGAKPKRIAVTSAPTV